MFKTKDHDDVRHPSLSLVLSLTHTHTFHGKQKVGAHIPFTQVNHTAVAQNQLGYIHPKHLFMETENITVSILNIHNHYADCKKERGQKRFKENDYVCMAYSLWRFS